MIITRTPYRISFFGGGTDYPAWYRREGGQVLSTTIDRYCYVMCRYLPPFFDIRHRVVWSQIDLVDHIADMRHPAVRGALQMLGFDDRQGIELHHHGDLPARTGIGSSSAFAAGLISALSALQGRTIKSEALALAAIRLEQEVLGEAVGSQDQVAAAYGGLNRITFAPNGKIAVEPVVLAPQRRLQLESRLLMFYTGLSRTASEVAVRVIRAIETGVAEAHLRQLSKLVPQAIDLLQSSRSLDEFGEMLHAAWMLKRQIGDNIANDHIDQIYERARAAGAIGGKLLGAGESGFMVFYVPDHRHDEVKRALKDLLIVPIGFSTEGATIIHQTPSDVR